MRAATERWAVLLTAGLMVVGAGSPVDESLDGLVAANTAARGGPAAIEAVHSVQIDVRIEEPSFAVDAIYRAARDGSMRIDVYDADGRRVYTEALDDGRAWSQVAGDDAPIVTTGVEGTAALRHGAESPMKLFGLHEMTRRGHELVFRGRQHRALHVDADPQPHWVETRFEDYRAVDGVLFPFRQVESRLDTGEVLATTTTRRIVVNP